MGEFVRDVNDVVPLAQKPEVASVSINYPEKFIQVSHLTVVRASDSTTLVRSNGEERTVRVVSEPSGSSIGLEGYTEDQLRKKQEQDKTLAFLMQWLKTGEEPKEGTLILGSPDANFYWVTRRLLYWAQGVP